MFFIGEATPLCGSDPGACQCVMLVKGHLLLESRPFPGGS